MDCGPRRGCQLLRTAGEAGYSGSLVSLLILRYTSSGITFYNPSVSLFRSPFLRRCRQCQHLHGVLPVRKPVPCPRQPQDHLAGMMNQLAGLLEDQEP